MIGINGDAIKLAGRAVKALERIADALAKSDSTDSDTEHVKHCTAPTCCIAERPR